MGRWIANGTNIGASSKPRLLASRATLGLARRNGAIHAAAVANAISAR